MSRTHVHPECFVETDPLTWQIALVHEEDDNEICELTYCTYEYLTPDAKRESEEAAQRVIARKTYAEVVRGLSPDASEADRDRYEAAGDGFQHES